MIRKLTKKEVGLLLGALLLASLINMVPATLVHGEYSPAAARVFSNSREPQSMQTPTEY